MIDATVWYIGSQGTVKKTHLSVPSVVEHLTHDDKSYELGKALFDQRARPAINLIAFKF